MILVLLFWQKKTCTQFISPSVEVENEEDFRRLYTFLTKWPQCKNTLYWIVFTNDVFLKVHTKLWIDNSKLGLEIKIRKFITETGFWFCTHFHQFLMSRYYHTMIYVLRVSTCVRTHLWCSFLSFTGITRALWYFSHGLIADLAGRELLNKKKKICFKGETRGSGAT